MGALGPLKLQIPTRHTRSVSAGAAVILLSVFLCSGPRPGLAATFADQDAPETRKLGPNETQETPIRLLEHQAVDIDVEQVSGSVVVQWQEGSGKESTARISEDGNHGHVRVTIVADKTGTWRFRVAPRKAQPVEYKVYLGAPRVSRDDDIERAVAGDALAQAEDLRNKGAKANAVLAGSDYREAITQYQKAKDSCGVRNSLNGLAHLQIATQQYAAARTSTEQGIAERCDDPASKAQSLRTFQSAVSRLGDLEAKISSGEEALAIYRQTGDLGYQGLVLGNLSGAYAQEGATGEALQAAQEALDLARASGDQDGIVYDEETLGAIHLQRGEYQLALQEFDRTLDDLKDHPYAMVESMAATNVGSANSALGDSEDALTAFRRAEDIGNKSGDSSVLADALNDEGSYHLSRREFSQARALFERALAISIDKQFKRKQATSLQGLGAAEIGEGHFESGLPKLLEALALARSLHDDFTELESDLSLGDYYLSRKEFDKAREADGQSRELAEQSYTTPQLVMAWASLARVEQASNNLDRAQTDSTNALAIIEDQRTQVNEPDLRSTFFQSTRSYYDLNIQILMALEAKSQDESYARRALEVAENARARALTDLLAERAINVTGAVPQDLLRQRNDAQDALHSAAYRLSRLPVTATKGERNAAEASIQESKQKLDQAEGAIRAADRRYADLTRPPPLTLSEIQKHLLDSNTVLLEYWLSEKESYLWEVTPESIHSYHLPPAGQLDADASRLRFLLASWPELPAGISLQLKPGYDAKRAAQIIRLSSRLGKVLLGPVSRNLGNRNVVVVADGSLRGIPFGLLTLDSSATLQQRNAVTYLPSAGTLRWLRPEHGESTARVSVAVFADPVFEASDPRLTAHAGDPTSNTDVTRALRDANTQSLSRLVWSRREAQSITSNLPPDKRWLALDFDANRESVLKASWQPYGVVHFATHSLIDFKNPQLSGVVLSLYDKQGQPVDGFLRVTDIYNLSLPVQLVVLSTCDSAADSAALGDDVYSLTNAFFYAGTPRILASLWSVDDRAAAAFMAYFYRALLARHLPPSEALRYARTAMVLDSGWRAPYYWSGFVLEGDWR